MIYKPNKAMLILDNLDKNHEQVKKEILTHLGMTDTEFDQVVGWLAQNGADVDLSKANPFFDMS